MTSIITDLNIDGQLKETAGQEGPVIIVDDNGYDASIAQCTIEEVDLKYPVQIVCSGEDLIAYLKGEGGYTDRAAFPLPGLVLLDLNMPYMDGFAVLDWLRNHPEHARVPVVVLSGRSDLPQQVTKSFERGAKFFLTKPINVQDFKAVVSALRVSV